MQTCIVKRFQNRTLQIESPKSRFDLGFLYIFFKAIRLKSIAERMESNRIEKNTVDYEFEKKKFKLFFKYKQKDQFSRFSGRFSTIF